MNEMMIIGLIFGALFGAAMALDRTRNERSKQQEAAGRLHGYEAAKKLGCEKAFRIAETLPDCAYRDGYTQGVAEVEDETQ